MQVVQPREYERELQLLPGSAGREAALVDSVEELKAQMDRDNKISQAKSKRNKIIAISTIVAVGSIFLAGKNLPRLFKTLGALLSLGILVKGADNMKSHVIELPESKNFSAKDRAYSFLSKINTGYNESNFLKLVVKVTLDVMIATKLIKPLDIKVKQSLLKSNNKLGVKEDIKEAVIEYKSNVR